MRLAGVSVGFVLGVAAVLLMGQTGAKKEGQAPPAPQTAPEMPPDMSAAMKACKDAMTPTPGAPEARRVHRQVGHQGQGLVGRARDPAGRDRGHVGGDLGPGGS